MPFSPPMSPYMMQAQSPASGNILQDQLPTVKKSDKIGHSAGESSDQQLEKPQNTQNYTS